MKLVFLNCTFFHSVIWFLELFVCVPILRAQKAHRITFLERPAAAGPWVYEVSLPRAGSVTRAVQSPVQSGITVTPTGSSTAWGAQQSSPPQALWASSSCSAALLPESQLSSAFPVERPLEKPACSSPAPWLFCADGTRGLRPGCWKT